MAKMRVVQVAKAGGPLEMVERDIPQPLSGQVRIKVQACGVCHSDSIAKEGYFPGIDYPNVPGHEVAVLIDAMVSDVSGGHWKVGQRVDVSAIRRRCPQAGMLLQESCDTFELREKPPGKAGSCFSLVEPNRLREILRSKSVDRPVHWTSARNRVSTSSRSRRTDGSRSASE